MMKIATDPQSYGASEGLMPLHQLAIGSDIALKSAADQSGIVCFVWVACFRHHRVHRF
jgi:hypothetical protein